MYCLDTCIIIDLFDGKEEIKERLSKVDAKTIVITPINVCELYKGAVLSKVTKQRLEFIENLLQRIEVTEFSKFSCATFGEDYRKMKTQGRTIKDIDLMIAAMCKAENAILITRDKHFEHIPDLKVEFW